MLLVSLVSFAAITIYVASRRVFVVVVYFVIPLSPETFGYTLVLSKGKISVCSNVM
jgi:hypothetical protein